MMSISLALALTPVPAAATAPPPRAISSAAFRLSPPRIRTKNSGIIVYGSICRLPNRALLSPSQVEIDRVGADGRVAETIEPFLGTLSRRIDQACGHYSGSFATPLLPTETIVACISRRGRTCVGTK